MKGEINMTVGSVNFGTATPYIAKQESKKQEGVIVGTLVTGGAGMLIPAVTEDFIRANPLKLFGEQAPKSSVFKNPQAIKKYGKFGLICAAAYLTYRGIKALFSKPEGPVMYK